MKPTLAFKIIALCICAVGIFTGSKYDLLPLAVCTAFGFIFLCAALIMDDLDRIIGEKEAVAQLEETIRELNPGNQRLALMDNQRKRAMNMLLAVVDSDEFYDLLPGNGTDDYICQRLREKIEDVFKAWT